MTSANLNYLPDAPDEDASSAPLRDERKPLVLIVSDESETRLLLKNLLESWNYQTTEADGVNETIYAAVTRPPNLILLDVSYSFIESIDILRQMRKIALFGDVPFILLSGHAQPQFYKAAIDFGADEYLIKPINFAALEESLSKNIKRNEQNRLEASIL